VWERWEWRRQRKQRVCQVIARWYILLTIGSVRFEIQWHYNHQENVYCCKGSQQFIKKTITNYF
jgi:hypothetical protein